MFLGIDGKLLRREQFKTKKKEYLEVGVTIKKALFLVATPSTSIGKAHLRGHSQMIENYEPDYIKEGSLSDTLTPGAI